MKKIKKTKRQYEDVDRKTRKFHKELIRLLLSRNNLKYIRLFSEKRYKKLKKYETPLHVVLTTFYFLDPASVIHIAQLLQTLPAGYLHDIKRRKFIIKDVLYGSGGFNQVSIVLDDIKEIQENIIKKQKFKK